MSGLSPADNVVIDSDTASVDRLAPGLGVAKTVSEAPAANPDGSFALTYTVAVTNSGETDLDTLQLIDVLSDTFSRSTNWQVDDVASDELSINPGYDGRSDGDSELLLGTDSLAQGASASVRITVTVNPGEYRGPYENSATGSATSPSDRAVSDVSDSGTDPDPAATNEGEPGDTGGSDDPVPVTFPAPAPPSTTPDTPTTVPATTPGDDQTPVSDQDDDRQPERTATATAADDAANAGTALAFTGASVTGLLLLAGLMIGIGSGLTRRRRRFAETPD